MNASKTALVNTGIDLDQPKLCPDLTDLQWPDSFRLLGIEFTKFYEDYTDNYELPLKAINREMNKWEYRLPSPLGRAGIIKTCLLSKLTHMPISLPSPPAQFFVALEKKLHLFVWGVKAHKIKRARLYADHKEGGLKMIDIKDFWSALKISWFFRAENSQDLWAEIYRYMLINDGGIANTTDVLSLSDIEMTELAYKLSSHPFWTEALTCLSKIKKAYHLCHETRFRSLKVTRTRLLSKLRDGFIEFSHKDIHHENGDPVTINDLYTPGTWDFKTQHELTEMGIYLNTYMHETYVLDRLQAAISNLRAVHNMGNWEDKWPTFPKFILRKTGTAPFRKMLNLSKNFTLENDGICQRWEKRLEITVNPETWKKAFLSIHRGWTDPDFRYFTFRNMNLILGVGEKLEHTKEKINPSCTFCSLEGRVPPKETNEHLLYYCETSQNLLKHLFSWEPILILDGQIEKVFDYMIWAKGENRCHQMTINSLFSWVKYYIFSMRYGKKIPEWTGLKRYIVKHAKEMHQLMLYKGKSSDFSIFWRPEDYLNLEKGYLQITPAAMPQLPEIAEIEQIDDPLDHDETNEE